MSKIKEISTVFGTEAGAIKSFLDQWTPENAFMEYSDDKIDVKATKIKFEQFIENGKPFLRVYHNGIPFTYSTLFKYVTQFSWHLQHSDVTVGLRGCGRFWAIYTLIGYRYWNEPTFDTVTIESLENGLIHSAEIDIRFPQQVEGDVRMMEDRPNDWGDVWYTTVETIPMYDHIPFDNFAEDIRLSYPDSQNVEFILEDKIVGNEVTVKPIDMTYSMKYLKNDLYWDNLAIGEIREINEENVGTFMLMLIESPTTKKPFKCIHSILQTDFLRDTNNERMAKGGAQHKYGGLYAYKGGRFIVHGNSDHLANLLPDRGGKGLCRILIDMSDNYVANDFGVRTNKSNGIANMELSPIINPNHSTKDGTSKERLKDKLKNPSFVPGVYDYVLDLSTEGYNTYKNRYEKGVENKETKKKVKESVSKMPPKSVMKMIGETKACTSYVTDIIEPHDIVKSKSLDVIISSVIDCLEMNSEVIDNKVMCEIDGGLHNIIKEHLCSTFSKDSKKEEKEWLEKAFAE